LAQELRGEGNFLLTLGGRVSCPPAQQFHLPLAAMGLALPLTGLPCRLVRLPAALSFVVLSNMVRWSAGQADVNRVSFAAAAFSTTMQCRVSLQNMIYNDDWRFMNDSASRWCRVKLENRMSTCCTNAEFAKGKADSCSDCSADCANSKMVTLCNGHFGKACSLTRKPFAKNNISMKVTETFCVPKDCDNSEDLKNNLLIKWFDAQYRSERTTLWMYDYGDTETLSCPSAALEIALGIIGAVIIMIISIPVGIFLFKAPKERGRVLRGIDDDEDDEEPEETPVDLMQPIGDH